MTSSYHFQCHFPQKIYISQQDASCNDLKALHGEPFSHQNKLKLMFFTTPNYAIVEIWFHQVAWSKPSFAQIAIFWRKWAFLLVTWRPYNFALRTIYSSKQNSVNFSHHSKACNWWKMILPDCGLPWEYQVLFTQQYIGENSSFCLWHNDLITLHWGSFLQ